MRGEKCQIVGDGLFGALPRDRQLLKFVRLDLGALPRDIGKSGRWRKQPLRATYRRPQTGLQRPAAGNDALSPILYHWAASNSWCHRQRAC